MPEKQQGKCHTLEKNHCLKSWEWEKACERVGERQKGRGEAEEPRGLSHWSYKTEVFPSGWADRCCRRSGSGAI